MIVQVSCTLYVCMIGTISVHVNVHVSILYCKLLASIKIHILHLLKLDKLYMYILTYCSNK